MNETLKAIMERYSCRNFSGAPLTSEQVKCLIDAALAAPSAVNRQPWRLIVIMDKMIIEEMDAEGMDILASGKDKAAYERMKSRGGELFYNAPLLVLILSDGSKWGMLDSGILCQNIAIAAQSIGLATCIVGMAAIPLGGPNGAELKKRLQFPDGFEFAIGILAGTANSGKDPHELDYDKVTYIG